MLNQFTALVGTERYKINPDPATFQEAIDRVINKEATYFLDGSPHCAAWKRRSLIDICRVVLNYFDVSIQEIIDYIAEKIANGKHYTFVCSTIKRQVVDKSDSPYVASDPGYKNRIWQNDLKKDDSFAAHLFQEAVERIKNNKNKK